MGPGTRIGVLGGGQLGRMLAEAGRPLGFTFRFWDPGSAEAIQGFGDHLRAAWDDDDAFERFVEGVEVVTLEFENVPVELVRRIAARVPVRPGAAALEVAQDRLNEKRRFTELGIRTNAFRSVDSESGLGAALDEIGMPAVLKTRRLGYDGKGQRVLRDAADVEGAFDALGGVPCILEAFVPFDREVSLVAVRTLEGELHPWPLVENRHHEGILVRTDAPADGVSESVRRQAEEGVRALADSLDYVGTLAVEFFQTGDVLLANEMAPRVHNSGHWTQDGATTSQFENHLRAITALPLGPASLARPTVMLNLIGERGDPATLLEYEGSRLHDYGKSPRPGRKVGHVNLVGSTATQARQRAEALLGHLGGGEPIVCT
ncbi:MAG: 5-(carboxyamino)imidazole ribonucleotide synthase [Longimicrobiales bacterium]|nr:5-(carboxyamino)imidazole ribonucleotide synthase [Longimicrobiales bacterium]